MILQYNNQHFGVANGIDGITVKIVANGLFQPETCARAR